MKKFYLCLLIAFIHVSIGYAESNTYYVKTDGTTENEGRSWADATDLQSALDKVVDGDYIKVAEGIYNPTKKSGAGTHGNRTRAFLIRNNITLEGGYSKESTDGNEKRDLTSYPTILSGANSEDPSFNVVIVAGPSNSKRITPTLAGLTITGGRATTKDVADGEVNVYHDKGRVVDVRKYCGGGLYNIYADPVIRNVTITDNEAEGGTVWIGIIPVFVDGDGGGVYNDNASPKFVNVLICKNESTDDGGGMYNSTRSNPQLINVAIAHNKADDGGGMYNETALFSPDARPLLYNTIVYGNTADEDRNICNVDAGTYIHSLVEGIDLSGTNNLEKNTPPGWKTDSYELSEQSELIDRGEKSYNDTPIGCKGYKRVIGKQIDLGPFEFQTQAAVVLSYTDSQIEIDAPSHPSVDGKNFSILLGESMEFTISSKDATEYNYSISIDEPENCGLPNINGNKVTIPDITGAITATIINTPQQPTDREITFTFNNPPGDMPQIEVGGYIVQNPYKLADSETELAFKVLFSEKYSKFELDDAKVLPTPSGVIAETGKNTFNLSGISGDITVTIDCENPPVNTYNITINTDARTSVPGYSPPVSVDYGSDYPFTVDVDPWYKEIVLVNGKTISPVNNQYIIRSIKADVVVNVTSVEDGEAPTPPVPEYFNVELPDMEGVIFNPSTLINVVKKGDDFVFDLKLKEGYIAPDLKVTTSRGNTLVLRSSDNKYIIEDIYETIEVFVDGVQKDPLGNVSVEDGSRVYTRENILFVEVSKAVVLSIYTIDGKLQILRQIEEGETSLPLSQGTYIIRLDNVSYKIQVKY